MKTVVFAFDALDFRYLDAFADSLPNLSALRDRGLEAPLQSTHPPWTGSAWPSMYTGTDPSHHGVYGFFRYDGYPDEGELVDRTDVDRPAIWNYCSQDGLSSVVVNVPVTHPADPIDGVLLPGYLAVEDEPGHPAGIRDELTDAIGEPYRIYARGEVSDDKSEKYAGYRDLIDLRRRAATSLLERREWDLAVLQVQKTDAVFHNFTDNDRFRGIYDAADRLVGDVLETAGADGERVNVVVCSDHGIGPVDGYQIHVNEILARHGYVQATDEASKPTLESEKTSLLGEDAPASGSSAESEAATESGANAGALERTARLARDAVDRLGVEPADVYAAAERVGLESALVKVTPDSIREAAGKSVDWRASRAYCSDSTRLGVRINLAGREPDGVVPRAAYEDVRGEIIDLLSDLETPDGDRAFEFVARRETIYDGPHADRAPDIVFRPAGMNHTVSPTLYGREFVSVDTYDHKRTGAFLAAGPAFDGDAPDELSLPDVAPITMAALGRPIPERMTGRAPPGLFSSSVGIERREYGDVPYACGDGGDDESGESNVEDRLEDLGYL